MQKLLLDKIDSLEKENKELKKRINHLESLLNIKEEKDISSKSMDTIINERLNLFNSYFKGRDDVYAIKRVTKDNKKVYYPVIQDKYKTWNESKKRYDISRPKGVSIYEAYTQDILKRHLSKFDLEFSIGIYPLIDGDFCYFVAIDFDGDNWQEDIKAVIEVSADKKIPFLIERSQSGNGAHLWYFFEDKTSAYKARRMATILLNKSMRISKSISLKSYDRIFPSQDTLNKDGIGNLIALPLDAKARQNKNSIFLDNNLIEIDDNKLWEHLKDTKKISPLVLDGFLKTHEKNYEYEVTTNSTKHQTQGPFSIIKEDGLKIKIASINASTLANLRMIASFKNPEFFKKQKMRFSTWDTPRMISTAYKDNKYIYLPRNCQTEVEKYLVKNKIEYSIEDKRLTENKINPKFKGKLRPEQETAFNEIINYEQGIIAAPTGFGKTVLGAKLISHLKENTLIIVPNKTLLYQWQDALNEFLDLEDNIGLLGDGTNFINNYIDIAIVNSLEKHKSIIKNYGLVLVDECHHAASIRYETILRKVKSKYIYGLSATPIRNDGLQKIIFMYIGDIIYKLSHKEDYKEKAFIGKVFPILTSYESIYNKFDMHKIYEHLSYDTNRNNIIVDKLLENIEDERSVLILSTRIDQLETISVKLHDLNIDHILLTGSQTTKLKREMTQKIEDAKILNQSVVILSTGQYIGEGFDFPALDTLIMASPIAWKGNIIQYVGRVNREHKNKKEVRVYDLVDFKVPVLSRMYDKRLRAYKNIGYEILTDEIDNIHQTLFNAEEFDQVLQEDLKNASKEIIVSSPMISRKYLDRFLDTVLQNKNNIKVTLVTQSQYSNLIDEAFMFLAIADIDAFSTEKELIPFVLIDEKIIWYGSINPLNSYHKDDSILRLYQSSYYDEFKTIID